MSCSQFLFSACTLHLLISTSHFTPTPPFFLLSHHTHPPSLPLLLPLPHPTFNSLNYTINPPAPSSPSPFPHPTFNSHTHTLTPSLFLLPSRCGNPLQRFFIPSFNARTPNICTTAKAKGEWGWGFAAWGSLFSKSVYHRVRQVVGFPMTHRAPMVLADRSTRHSPCSHAPSCHALGCSRNSCPPPPSPIPPSRTCCTLNSLFTREL